jgi:hypothetical protein
MKEINQLYKTFEGKKILILTKQKLHYKAKVLSVSENEILILDKFQNKVLIPLCEIAQVTELGGQNGN